MRAHRHRPVHLIVLSLLMGTTSLFAWLWLVVLPTRLFLADRLATLYRPPAIMIALSSLALLGGVAAGGLGIGAGSPLARTFVFLGSL